MGRRNGRLTMISLTATSGRPVVRSVPLRLLPRRSVLSVSRRRRSVKILPRPLVTGYEQPPRAFALELGKSAVF